MLIAEKRQFIDDGWEMYDKMEATYKFSGNQYDSMGWGKQKWILQIW